METPTICHNYRIYHKNRICTHVPARVDVVQCLGKVFMLSYELFTLFAQKNRTTIYGLHRTRGFGVYSEVDLRAC
jgi:hypothetical protein